jgi:RNA polymerase sigma-70 factor, ECF subfamily
MLGTLADAEDAVQETFVRLTRHGVDGIEDLEGWLITVAGRVCLDRLRADKTRRRYIGPWLPEPILEPAATAPDPADQVTLDDSVRMALLTVLQTLTPAERVAFVLHDVFGLTFDEIGGVVGRTAEASRKLASRARVAIRSDPEPRFEVTAAQAQTVAERFAAACRGADLAALSEVLAPDVVGEFDSGGRIAGAPLEPLVGAGLVSITLAHTLFGAAAEFRVTGINGQAGVVVSLGGRVMAVIGLETDGRVVHAIRAVGNPDKLSRINR